MKSKFINLAGTCTVNKNIIRFTFSKLKYDLIIERVKMFKYLLLITLILSVTFYAQMAQPKLVLKESSFDFGNIKQGKTVSHTFVVSNKGEALLKILDVKASCGCTAVAPEKKELKPGESTNVVVKFNSTGREGKQTKTVTITSNDPQNSKSIITFTGNILVPKQTNSNVNNASKIYFPEIEHNFGKVQEGQKLTYSFRIFNKGSAGLLIKEVKCSSGCTATLSSMTAIKPGQEGSIQFEFDTKNSLGKITKTVTVQSNDPNEPRKILTIYADVIKKGD